MEKSERNIKDIVLAFVNETDRHLFITGKAGTGKTTLLREIRTRTQKNIAVAAPTGIAAINADGVTLHSLLKLPTEIVLPTNQRRLSRKTIGDVLAELSFSPAKEKVIQELDILIIDEVSMVRADLLDAIDRVLSEVRKNPEPFGGVQMIYFGDLFQLPPVANGAEESELKQYYRSIFFFDSLVIQKAPPIYIELTEVYRQTDAEFLKLLNHIRDNQAANDDLKVLSARMLATSPPPEGQQVITLTSHRKKADQINIDELDKLLGEEQIFAASVDGQIDEKRLPFELELRLKVGTQVMFVKNDTSAQRKYYNGKIANVVELSRNHVDVQLPEGEIITVEPESWQNMEYKPIEGTSAFEQSATGEVKQLPLKLAWAITIHKSQGLTFDRAIIDAGNSFEPGQVYVALSRIRTLGGVFLMTPITLETLHSRPEVIAYTNKSNGPANLLRLLEDEKTATIFRILRDKFRLLNLSQLTAKTPSSIEKFRYSANAHFLQPFNTLQIDISKLAEVGAKFAKELDAIWENQTTAMQKGSERIASGAVYFSAEIRQRIHPRLISEMSGMLAKRAPKELMAFYGNLEKLLLQANSDIQQVEQAWRDLLTGTEGSDILARFQVTEKLSNTTKALAKTSGAVLTAVQKAILKLYRENLSIAEIAAKRNVSAPAIEGHIVELVSFGMIAAETILPAEKIKNIEKCLQAKSFDIHAAKHQLGNGVSFFEIRVVLAHLKASSNDDTANQNPMLF